MYETKLFVYKSFLINVVTQNNYIRDEKFMKFEMPK